MFAGLKKVTNISSAAVVEEWGSRTERGAVQLQRRRRCCDSCSALCAHCIAATLCTHCIVAALCIVLHCAAAQYSPLCSCCALPTAQSTVLKSLPVRCRRLQRTAIAALQPPVRALLHCVKEVLHCCAPAAAPDCSSSATLFPFCRLHWTRAGALMLWCKTDAGAKLMLVQN